MVERKKPLTEAQLGIVRPENEEVWMACRARKSCKGNTARVLLKKNEGIQGTWIQYICKTCNTPFSVRY
jgi:hypothetical protein